MGRNTRLWQNPCRKMMDLLDEHGPVRPWVAVDADLEDGELVVRADLPGVDRQDDLRVHVVTGRLRIEGRRPGDHRAGFLRERQSGPFAREVPLPRPALGSVRCSYLDGVLEVHVPLASPALGLRAPTVEGRPDAPRRSGVES